MSYEEISGLIKEIDNLVSAEGVQLMTWYLDEKVEFDNMLNCLSDYEMRVNYSFQFESDYKENLIAQIEEAGYDQSKEILNKHLELWYTLCQKSELSARYFTCNHGDLFKRITPLARQEATILLNAYNFMPEKLLQEYNTNPMIELGEHKIMSYIVWWKWELLERYRVVCELQSRYIKKMAYGNDRLYWAITQKQTKQLVSLFKRYFLSTTDEALVVKIIRGQELGNIVWLKSTEALVYFFTLLFEKGYMQTKGWAMVLTRRMIFCSKQGNIINHKNINASLYRIKHKKSDSVEQKEIERILHRFELIK